MKRNALTVKRISSVTLLKIMLITAIFPWVLFDTGVILYHLISGDLVVNYTRGSGADKIAEQMSLGKYVLISYPLFVMLGTIFTLIFWIPCAFSLWLWSKIRNMQIDYYELDGE
jgi:hypothetical protein